MLPHIVQEAIDYASVFSPEEANHVVRTVTLAAYLSEDDETIMLVAALHDMVERRGHDLVLTRSTYGSAVANELEALARTKKLLRDAQLHAIMQRPILRIVKIACHAVAIAHPPQGFERNAALTNAGQLAKLLGA